MLISSIELNLDSVNLFIIPVAGSIETNPSLSSHTIDVKFTEEHSALKRNAQLDEIGKSALYFVSDLSSAVTGEVHYVDCGYNIIGMPSDI